MSAKAKGSKEPVQRRKTDESISSPTKSSSVSMMKKSVSHPDQLVASKSNSTHLSSQEELKLTSYSDRLCPGMDMMPPGGKKLGSSHSSVSPEESISGAINDVLQTYTESPQTSLVEIKQTVSWLYDLVGKTVNGVLEKVTVQESPDADKLTGFKVTATVVFGDDENLPISLSQYNIVSSTSPIPLPIIIERQSSVETAPNSALSQRSVGSPHPSSSMNTDTASITDTNNSDPVKVKCISYIYSYIVLHAQYMTIIISIPVRGRIKDFDRRLPYSYKFLRNANFAVSADDVRPTKIKSSKFYILKIRAGTKFEI